MKAALIYHQVKPNVLCPDGIASAFVAHKYFTQVKNKAVTLFGCSYGQPAPNLDDYELIVIVDFSFPASTISEWTAQSKEVLLIDHHKTALEHLGDVSTFSDRFTSIFDLTECGATLTWKYLNPNLPTPALLDYVKDRDLWNWKLPYSKEINEALAYLRQLTNTAADLVDIEPEYYVFALYDRLLPLSQQELIEKLKPLGEERLTLKQLQVSKAASKFQWQQLPQPRPVDLLIPVVVCEPEEERLISDICSKLYADLAPEAPFVACVTHDGKWSLRSNKHGSNYDVSTIAKHYGGGGHNCAAGFVLVQDR